ncbi:OLFD protein, partial [Crocuta crocuta]
MTGKNQTVILEFLLIGPPIKSELRDQFYALFLVMYVTTVVGNLLIIILIRLNLHLHTPMYLFLSNLSFSDLCFSSVTMPKLLQNMQSQVPSIPYAGCLTQMYFFLFFGDLESFLLVAMAYDRYVAICFPLHYGTIMSPKLCLSLVVLSWVLTMFHAMLHTLLMARFNMKMGNQSVISEFLLLGLPIEPEQQDLFYALFLAMYVTTVLGNLLIVILIRLDSRLHTPMYLFLSNLSFSDLCFSSVTMPKLLQNMQSQVPSIPYAGCLAQMYFFLLFADLESFLLVAMAYDRYVAICFPLHYTIIMSPKLCLSLVVLSWVLTTFISLLHTLLMARLSFCADNVIPHFFCDMSALLKLACSDIQINEMVIFLLGGLVIIVPFLLIFLSYARIVSSILKVPSARGIRKAFSTCGSHLS